MTFRHLAVWGTMTVAVLCTATACSKDKKDPDVLAQDSSLTSDLALANRDSTAQPQLKDVPATTPPVQPAETKRVETPAPRPRPQPRAPTPAPIVPAPPITPAPAPAVTASGNTVESRAPSSGNTEGSVGTVAAGTNLALQAGQRVCTNTNTVGDRLTATLAEAITASNGVVIPAGATAIVEVTGLKRSEQAGDKMNISLTVRSINYGGKTYPINGEIASTQTEKVRAGDNNDAGKVIGGAAVGAVLGRVFGGKNKTKGTIIGAAGGAAAGAVLANQTANYDACIPVGGRIVVRLNQALSVQGAPQSAPSSGI